MVFYSYRPPDNGLTLDQELDQAFARCAPQTRAQVEHISAQTGLPVRELMLIAVRYTAQEFLDADTRQALEGEDLHATLDALGRTPQFRQMALDELLPFGKDPHGQQEG